jgi:hypothetical protein
MQHKISYFGELLVVKVGLGHAQLDRTTDKTLLRSLKRIFQNNLGVFLRTFMNGYF